MLVFCTLFNTTYIDKGLVLYDSLEKVTQDFVLYVLAMDDKCYEILVAEDKKHLYPIRLSDFENEKLLVAKKNRPAGQYFWTCSSSLVKYVLETYNTENCTYIDADMYFYQDPQVLINEMKSKGASALVVGHRFSWYDKKVEQRVGRFCVEFNSFLNVESAIGLLNKWVNQCIESCELLDDGIHYGDQMYINNWDRDYEFVVETEQLGAGLGPWNFDQYKMVSHDTINDKYVVRCRRRNYPLIFMHFENISFLSDSKANVKSLYHWTSDREFGSVLYRDYLKRIKAKKLLLREKYNVETLIASHPALDNTNNKNRLHQMLSSVASLFTIQGMIDIVMKSIPARFFSKYNIIDF